jgi:hypothetical protein
MDLSHWIKTPWINIDFRRDFGKEMLVATTSDRPQFRLVPLEVPNGFGKNTPVAFHTVFEPGRMLPNWTSLQFVPRGNQPVPALSRKLPAWAGSSEHEELYTDVLDPLTTALQAEKTNIERLEGRIPMFLNRCSESKQQITVDRVRMVYLKDAVEGKEPNLVVMTFSYADGFKVMQNGVGSGPPRDTGP